MSTTGEAEPVVVARFRTWSACGSGLLYCYDPRRPPTGQTRARSPYTTGTT
ncbi:hypothetical protein [Streptomyces sp. V2I9]|uniref:hypothetical protein n=1 Tax=Streptomyces sp. V2I9 TaxID=3042304 RepID=UPI002786027E|nr:hypothetical protein [Streptomyces sp. V2I9]MDQ0984124.1 hypothetical protein [Streptomyces sp. V2I9]